MCACIRTIYIYIYIYTYACIRTIYICMYQSYIYIYVRVSELYIYICIYIYILYAPFYQRNRAEKVTSLLAKALRVTCSTASSILAYLAIYIYKSILYIYTYIYKERDARVIISRCNTMLDN